MRPVAVGDVPSALVAIIAKKLAAVRVTVEAALTCNREAFVEALLLDGAVTELDTARALANELLAAQRQYLPSGWDV